MIQIRCVPDELYRRLKSRAAEMKMSLSDYLLAEIRRSAEPPTSAELWRRLRSRTVVSPSTAPAEAIRQEREPR